MAELTYENENYRNVNYRTEEMIANRPNWGAIWSGTFTFIAIWAVFGMLGAAIFASAANPDAAHPTGMNVGLAIWAVILTIIAMFVAGRVTGQLAATSTASSRRMQGMVMFGLSVTAALVITVIGGNAFGNARVATETTTPYLLALLTDLGWPLFVALFLGWLSAMGGAATAHRELSARTLHQQPSHAS